MTSNYKINNYDLDNMFILSPNSDTNHTDFYDGNVDIENRYVLALNPIVNKGNTTYYTHNGVDLNTVFEYGPYTAKADTPSYDNTSLQPTFSMTGNFYYVVLDISGTNYDTTSYHFNKTSVKGARQKSSAVTITIDALQYDSTYTYSVTPYNGKDTPFTPTTGTITVPSPIASVSNQKATATHTYEIKVTWSLSNGGYVNVSCIDPQGNNVGSSNTNTTGNAQFDGLTANATYTFNFTPVNFHGKTGTTVSTTETTFKKPVITATATPDGDSGNASNEGITVSYTDSGGGSTVDNVVISGNNQSDTLMGKTNSKDYTGLTGGKNYSFTLTPYNSAGDPGDQVSVNATTNTPPPAMSPPMVPPMSPPMVPAMSPPMVPPMSPPMSPPMVPPMSPAPAWKPYFVYDDQKPPKQDPYQYTVVTFSFKYSFEGTGGYIGYINQRYGEYYNQFISLTGDLESSKSNDSTSFSTYINFVNGTLLGDSCTWTLQYTNYSGQKITMTATSPKYTYYVPSSPSMSPGAFVPTTPTNPPSSQGVYPAGNSTIS